MDINEFKPLAVFMEVQNILLDLQESHFTAWDQAWDEVWEAIVLHKIGEALSPLCAIEKSN